MWRKANRLAGAQLKHCKERGEKNSSLHFTPASKRQKYAPYREAWHLLQANPGLTIQASSDDQSPEENPHG